MKNKGFWMTALLIALALILAVNAGAAPGIAAPGIQTAQDEPDQPEVGVGNNFSYQGRLVRGGSPANGLYDFRFILYDDPSGGSQIGTTEFKDDVNVRNGTFTVILSFGDVFNGQLLFLEVAVRPGDQTGLYITLSPRHPTWAKPYAIFSTDSYRLGGDIASSYQKRVSGTCAAGSAIRVVNQDGTVNCETISGTYWSLNGNNGTTTENYLGTRDLTTLTLKANQVTGWRLVPKGNYPPNLIGGDGLNWITPDVYGATIGGGGGGLEMIQANSVTDIHGTVAGGLGNQAGDDTGSLESAYGAFVGGGYYNDANAALAVIPGGSANVITATGGTIGGGWNNSVTAPYGTIPGGSKAVASHFGELAYSGGNTSNNPAQTSLYVPHYVTDDLETASLFLNGASEKITIAPDRAVSFDILIVGRSDEITGNGQSAGYKIEGVIQNSNGTVSFIGTPTLTVLGEDDAAWGAAVVADDANDALDIRVTGADGDTIYWAATVRTVEIQIN